MTGSDMRSFTLTDDFGRSHVFCGEKLVGESTDTVAGTKPQWLDVDVYRTAAGSFVVARTTHYRLRHLNENCVRAEGYELIEPTVLDTFPCPSCNREGQMEGGWAQADRINIEAHHTPQELIAALEVDGKHSNLSRTILADVAEQDERVDAIWNTVVVP